MILMPNHPRSSTVETTLPIHHKAEAPTLLEDKKATVLLLPTTIHMRNKANTGNNRKQVTRRKVVTATKHTLHIRPRTARTVRLL
jgi:hypothetical protein